MWPVSIDHTSFVIDVMAYLQKVSVTGLSNFQNLVLALASLCSVYHQYTAWDDAWWLTDSCLVSIMPEYSR